MPCQSDLIERAGESGDPAAAPLHACPNDVFGCLRRLYQQHPAPAVCGDSDYLFIPKRGNVGRLEYLSPIIESRAVRIRAQKHGAVAMRRQEYFEQNSVGITEDSK